MDEKFIGDNGVVVDTDYALEDYGEVMDKILKMPVLSRKNIRHYSQYHPELIHVSKTGCTVMSGTNAFASNACKDLTIPNILSIYDQAISTGFVPGGPWSRSEGVLAVKRWTDKNDPENSFLYFTVNFFSDEFTEVAKRLHLIPISITVDSAYRKDVRADLDVDGDIFAKVGSHATNIRFDGQGLYRCPDSISQKDPTVPMFYKFGDIEKLKKLRENKNIRIDCTVIVLNKWLKEIDPTEMTRLRNMRDALTKAIEANSAIYHLTDQLETQQRKHEENVKNRAHLKIVEAMLGIKSTTS